MLDLRDAEKARRVIDAHGAFGRGKRNMLSVFQSRGSRGVDMKWRKRGKKPVGA